MLVSCFLCALLILAVNFQHACVWGFAAYMLEDCDVSIKVGSVIMGQPAVASSNFYLSVFEENDTGTSGDAVSSVTPGVIYVVRTSNAKSQWAMQITNGKFAAGECGKSRITQGNGDTTFTVSSGAKSITLVAGSASKYGTVSVSPSLNLPLAVDADDDTQNLSDSPTVAPLRMENLRRVTVAPTQPYDDDCECD